MRLPNQRGTVRGFGPFPVATARQRALYSKAIDAYREARARGATESEAFEAAERAVSIAHDEQGADSATF